MKRITFKSQFYKYIGKSSKIRSLLLNRKGSDSSSYDVTHHKDDFFDKNQILFQAQKQFLTEMDIYLEI